MPRRRKGELLPLELAILRVAARSHEATDGEIHGFQLASELATGDEARKLLGHGTLYKALDRLEKAGLLTSRWEVIDESAEGRPRRRLYRLTAAGGSALAESTSAASSLPADLGLAGA